MTRLGFSKDRASGEFSTTLLIMGLSVNEASIQLIRSTCTAQFYQQFSVYLLIVINIQQVNTDIIYKITRAMA